jgi:deoxycytidylate deaminase
MSKHLRYLNFARNVAKLSDYKQHHIGSLLVYRKQIISIGYNTNKESPLQKEYNRYRNLVQDDVKHKIHSEILCLHRANKLEIDFEDCILYIFREHKNGVWALARPCNACFSLIKDLSIRTICYSTENGYSVEYL